MTAVIRVYFARSTIHPSHYTCGEIGKHVWICLVLALSALGIVPHTVKTPRRCSAATLLREAFALSPASHAALIPRPTAARSVDRAKRWRLWGLGWMQFIQRRIRGLSTKYLTQEERLFPSFP